MKKKFSLAAIMLEDIDQQISDRITLK